MSLRLHLGIIPPRVGVSARLEANRSTRREGELVCFLFSFVPGTVFLVLAFFVVISSTRAEGTMRRLGQVLAIWLLVVALFFPACGLYVTVSGLCPMGNMMQPTD